MNPSSFFPVIQCSKVPKLSLHWSGLIYNFDSSLVLKVGRAITWSTRLTNERAEKIRLQHMESVEVWLYSLLRTQLFHYMFIKQIVVCCWTELIVCLLMKRIPGDNVPLTELYSPGMRAPLLQGQNNYQIARMRLKSNWSDISGVSHFPSALGVKWDRQGEIAALRGLWFEHTLTTKCLSHHIAMSQNIKSYLFSRTLFFAFTIWLNPNIIVSEKTFFSRISRQFI